MAFYSVFLEAIPAYTGLSPVAFFTTLALMVGVYHLVCALFVSDPPPPNATSRSAMEMMSMPVNLEPVQLGDVTEEELRAYDGSDPTKPLLMAIKGQIYDVTRSRGGRILPPLPEPDSIPYSLQLFLQNTHTNMNTSQGNNHGKQKMDLVPYPISGPLMPSSSLPITPMSPMRSTNVPEYFIQTPLQSPIQTPSPCIYSNCLPK
ncbi:membrane steroid-binding protein 1 isoform X1 [Amborella trichopoda]|uniref:membrane steroid-binding protein 1 isoform X1 n=1 Tax=Amborella trichopoda TaxID=13333 RepID=UPI0009BDEDC4|nr:membrane steroid-binding protein 1 isoform X1 [Amborella trichopoda]|eukprot:XP_020518493.1 membrane steroid-binding protein 1 isoform X1 [Amborella trichopoda]